jgi:TRAP-type C4-dicarboxylate transport system permease small subunit
MLIRIFLEWVHRIALGLTVIVLVCLSLLSFIDVLARYFLSSPVPGTVEITEILVALIMIGALAAATWSGEHVSVELFVAKASERKQLLLKRLGAFAVLLTTCGLAYGLAERSLSLRETGDVTPVLRLSLLPPTLLACALSFAVVLIAAGVLFSVRRLERNLPDGESE